MKYPGWRRGQVYEVSGVEEGSGVYVSGKELTLKLHQLEGLKE